MRSAMSSIKHREVERTPGCSSTTPPENAEAVASSKPVPVEAVKVQPTTLHARSVGIVFNPLDALDREPHHHLRKAMLSTS